VVEKLFDIIFEDDDLLVINKPAGLVCHPTKNGELSSLIGRARLHLNASLSAAGRGEGKGEVGQIVSPVTRPSSLSRGEVAQSSIVHHPSSNPSPHLVNRLDRETSGVVIVAKNPVTAGELGKILESRAVEKEYLAIVHGHVAAEQGMIDAPLGKDEHSRVFVKDCVRPDGAPSQTEFWVERRFSRRVIPSAGGSFPSSLSAGGLEVLEKQRKEFAEGEGPQWTERASTSESLGRGEVGSSNSQFAIRNPQSSVAPPSAFSLLRVIPRTGRKHQIRIHLAHLGHPIVGDKLYGGDEDLYLALVENRLTAAQRAKLIFENHALHARAVRFLWRGKQIEFSCNPEPWFTTFLDTDCTDSRGPEKKIRDNS
jgi:23S rRNA-/tRNA-specific pseudouridylate synthase